MIFHPLSNKIIVEPIKSEDAVINGILVPTDILGEAVLKGVVIAAGPDATVKTGDTVAFGKYGFDELRDGPKKYYVMPEQLILTVIA